MVISQKGVDLFEGDGASPLRESLAKAGKLIDLQRTLKRSPAIRETFRRLFESRRPQDRELSQALGLHHVRPELYETTPRRASPAAQPRKEGLINLPLDELWDTLTAPRNYR